MPILLEKSTTIRVVDGQKRTVCSVHLDATGVRGFSGRLLAEQGDGQRLEVNPLELLQAVYDAGQRSVAQAALDKELG